MHSERFTELAACGHSRSTVTESDRTARKPSLALADVRRNDPLPDAEHVWIVWIDTDFYPVVVGAAESLKPGEVLDRRENGRAGYSRGQRLVSPEKVTVAMDEDDWLSECNRFLLQYRANISEAARVFFGRPCRRSMCGKDVRLLQNHDRTTVVGLRVFETLLQPGQVCLVATCVGSKTGVFR